MYVLRSFILEPNPHRYPYHPNKHRGTDPRASCMHVRSFIFWLKHQRPDGLSSHTTAYKYVEAVRKMIDRLEHGRSCE